MDNLEKFIETYSGGEYNALSVLKNKKGEIARLIQEEYVIEVNDNFDTYYRDEGENSIIMKFSANLLDKTTKEKKGSLEGIAQTNKTGTMGYSEACLTYKNNKLSVVYTRFNDGSAPYWAIIEIAAQMGIEKPSKEKWRIK